MSYEHIEAVMLDGLGTITLNRPPVNVLHIAMMKEINEALDSWRGQKDLKVVLFQAKGKCFSAGVDVGEHMGDLAPKMIDAFHGMFRRLETLGIPTVASVYGSCLGGGCELAIFCDMVVASEDAKFGQPEIMVGVFPPIAAQIMPRIIGQKAAMELILSGKTISAADARAMGLVNQVVTKDALESATAAFVKPFLNLSAEVLRLTKKAVKTGLMDPMEPSLSAIEDVYLNELLKTADAQEGLVAFLEKRKPQWRNE
jgi:cyclohexa-1,5-dienecarbonyl-CoA hydratase